jgi:hypothetical protein
MTCENCCEPDARWINGDEDAEAGYYCGECVPDYPDPYMGSDSDFSDHALGIDY